MNKKNWGVDEPSVADYYTEENWLEPNRPQQTSGDEREGERRYNTDILTISSFCLYLLWMLFSWLFDILFLGLGGCSFSNK